MQRRRDPKPRTGAAYIGLGEACLTPRLVMHYASFACSSSDWLLSLSLYLTEPHYHTSFACLTSDWLTCLSSDWLTCLSSDWLTFLSSDWLIFKTSSWQKNFTAYICVVASVSQRHPATSNVASHNSISYVMLSNVSVFGISNM